MANFDSRDVPLRQITLAECAGCGHGFRGRELHNLRRTFAGVEFSAWVCSHCRSSYAAKLAGSDESPVISASHTESA